MSTRWSPSCSRLSATNVAERVYKLQRETLQFRRAVAPLVDPLDRLAQGQLGVHDRRARVLPRRVRPRHPRARDARRHPRPARQVAAGEPRAGERPPERGRAEDLRLGRDRRRAHRDRRHLRHELPEHAGAEVARGLSRGAPPDAHDLRGTCTTASSARAGCRLPGHARRLHLLQDRRRRAAGRDRPGGRAHDRVHGHQPVDARPRARDPAEPLAQPLRRARRGPRAHRHGGQAPGDPRCATRSAATASTS